MSLTIKGATSGSVDVVAPASGSDVTLTLPSTTATVETTASSIASSRLTGALPAVSGALLTNLPAGGVDGIVSTANATAITIDSSENVGIGTTTPDFQLEIEGSASSYTKMLSIKNTHATGIPMLAIGDNPGAEDGCAILGYDNSNNVTWLGVNGATLGTGLHVKKSGNVGIGTSSPETNLHIQGDAPILTISGGTGDTSDTGIWFRESASHGLPADSSKYGFFIKYEDAGNTLDIDCYNGANTYRALSFDRASGQMHHSPSGIPGGTGGPHWYLYNSANRTAMLVENAVAGEVNFATKKPGTGTAIHYQMFNGNGGVGSIKTSGSSTSYNTTSDYRLKENPVPITDSIERIKLLKPYKFNFIADPTVIVDGFLAHEVIESGACPEAASGEKDAMTTEAYIVSPAVDEVRDDDGNVITEAVDAVTGEHEVIDPQGIDQSKLVPLLTAALQAAIKRIEALENA